MYLTRNVINNISFILYFHFWYETSVRKLLTDCCIYSIYMRTDMSLEIPQHRHNTNKYSNTTWNIQHMRYKTYRHIQNQMLRTHVYAAITITQWSNVIFIHTLLTVTTTAVNTHICSVKTDAYICIPKW